MDEFLPEFDDLKISAFAKVKLINPYVTNTTIGPNSTLSKDERTEYSAQIEKPKEELPVISKHSPPERDGGVMKRILSEIEFDRKETVHKAVNQRLNSMVEFSKRQNSESRQRLQKKQQTFMNGLQQQELAILSALEQHDKDALLHQEQRLLYYKELAERREQNNKEIEERERRKQRLNALLDVIKQNQVAFRNVYEKIIVVIKSCKLPQLKEVLGDIPKQLKAIPGSMEEIINHCKSGKISENDCNKSHLLVKQIMGLLLEVEQKIAQAQAAEDRAKEAPKNVAPKPPEPQAQQLEPPKAAANPTHAAPSSEPVKPAKIDSFISKPSLKFYSELQVFAENYRKSYQELEQNASFKQFRFHCKKAVNIPVNAISAVNVEHLVNKFNRLTGLLSGQTVEVGNTRVCAASHPQGIAFCTDLLARKLVLQGDLMISSNPGAAYAYAAIIIAIWHDNPAFGKLLLHHFHTQCPYLVPWHPPKLVEQTDQEFYLSQGYQYTDGAIEKQDKFLKRMTGIMRLYSAIIIALPKRGHQKNPLGLAEGWRWLGAFLNLQPKPDITATVLHVFLEITGPALQASYGKVFQKIMKFICNTYLLILKKIDTGGPVCRLELLLQDYQKRGGQFEVPQGILPNNFW